MSFGDGCRILLHVAAPVALVVHSAQSDAQWPEFLLWHNCFVMLEYVAHPRFFSSRVCEDELEFASLMCSIFNFSFAASLECAALRAAEISDEMWLRASDSSKFSDIDRLRASDSSRFFAVRSNTLPFQSSNAMRVCSCI